MSIPIEQLRHQILSKAQEQYKLCWKTRTRDQIMSVYDMLATLQHPQDWLAMAFKVANNPEHIHFGKSPEDIVKIWQAKTDYASNNGNKLDDFIQGVLGHIPPISIGDVIPDAQAKCRGFLKFKTEYLDVHNFQQIGCEIKCASKKLGFNGRLDNMSVVYHKDNSNLIIIDWKQNAEIPRHGFGRKLKPPFNHLDDCKHVQFTNQIHLYRYFFEEECKINIAACVIVHIKDDDYEMVKPAHQYNKELIESIATFAHQNKIKK